MYCVSSLDLALDVACILLRATPRTLAWLYSLMLRVQPGATVCCALSRLRDGPATYHFGSDGRHVELAEGAPRTVT